MISTCLLEQTNAVVWPTSLLLNDTYNHLKNPRYLSVMIDPATSYCIMDYNFIITIHISVFEIINIQFKKCVSPKDTT